jgi:hypothetical protein
VPTEPAWGWADAADRPSTTLKIKYQKVTESSKNEYQGRNKKHLKSTLLVDCRLGTEVMCDAETGSNRFISPHNSTSPYIQATGNYVSTGNQKI